MEYNEAPTEAESATSGVAYMDTEATAFGAIRQDRLEMLRNATPNPDDPQGLVPVFNAHPEGETVYLANAGEDRSTFALTVGGCDAVAYCSTYEGVLEISLGEDLPDERSLTKLENQVRVLCEGLLAPGYTIEPQRCTAAVDVDIPENLSEIIPDIITRARNRDLTGYEFVCGSESGGADARLFENGVTTPRQSSTGIKTLELTLYRSRLRDLAPVVQKFEGNIHGLVEGTLGYMLGSQDFPDPFIRVATSESRGEPNFMRPNVRTFEDAKVSAFESLALDESSQSDGLAKTTNGILSVFGVRR